MTTKVTEEMRPEKEWFKQAEKQTLKTLPDFINHVMNDYPHDYGTVCHAVAACALAAAWAANKEPNGGISGFQASFVMWDFIKQWNYPYNKCGMRIFDYDKMLYPQYEYKYEKTISKNVWERLRDEAKNLLAESGRNANPAVVSHWKSISAGVVPFGYTVED